jgi:ATP-dependent Lhr-like helicase
MRTWGMSATLPNAEEALDVLRGKHSDAKRAVVVTAPIERPVRIETVLPVKHEDLPWAGHLGLSMLRAVIRELDPAVPTLVFTNTRSQAERWFHALEFAKPEWKGFMALHHGSIERVDREKVEAALKDGTLRIVVATSSLDLGVDSHPCKRYCRSAVQRASLASCNAQAEQIMRWAVRALCDAFRRMR